MLGLIRDPSPSDQAIIDLRTRLDEFYARTTKYTAFQATVRRDDLYSLLDPVLERIASRKKPRVLELGAGLTGYPDYLKSRGLPIHFTAQDVTPTNLAYLQERCDAVHIGDIKELAEPFDLILSTFVLEHVSAPRAFLEQVKQLLSRGGAHVVVCPRYDLPGYVCPSLRHHSKPKQVLGSLALTASRLTSRLDRRPRFWINLDPSMLHGPWYRDADAVHVVSRFDIEQWHRDNGFDVQRLRVPYRGMRDWILKRGITLNLLCRRREQ